MPFPIQSNHMQIHKHEYTHIIQITQSCYVIIQLIHQNYLTWANYQTQAIQLESLDQTHIHAKIYFRVTIPNTVTTARTGRNTCTVICAARSGYHTDLELGDRSQE